MIPIVAIYLRFQHQARVVEAAAFFCESQMLCSSSNSYFSRKTWQLVHCYLSVLHLVKQSLRGRQQTTAFSTVLGLALTQVRYWANSSWQKSLYWQATPKLSRSSLSCPTCTRYISGLPCSPSASEVRSYYYLQPPFFDQINYNQNSGSYLGSSFFKSRLGWI